MRLTETLTAAYLDVVGLKANVLPDWGLVLHRCGKQLLGVKVARSHVDTATSLACGRTVVAVTVCNVSGFSVLTPKANIQYACITL